MEQKHIEVWERSNRLCDEVFQETTSLPDEEFRIKLCDVALSIRGNIVKGLVDNAPDEGITFLRIAYIRCGELRSYVFVGHRNQFFEEITAKKLMRESSGIASMLKEVILKPETETL